LGTTGIDDDGGDYYDCDNGEDDGGDDKGNGDSND
jgi:hypothetical protein